MATPPGDHDDDLYDLAPPAPAPAATAAVRSRPAVPAHPLPLAYQRPPASAVSSGLDERKLKDFQMPLWFLCGGIVIETIAEFIELRAFAPAMRQVGLNLVVGTALMLAGTLLAARVRGIELGRFWNVVLKLAAV